MCQGPPLVKAPARQQHNFRLDFLASRDPPASRLPPRPSTLLSRNSRTRLRPHPPGHARESLTPSIRSASMLRSDAMGRGTDEVGIDAPRFRLESTRLGFGVAKPVEASLVSLNSVTSSQARLFSRKTRKVSGIDIFMLNIIHLADKGDIDVPKLDPFTRRERCVGLSLELPNFYRRAQQIARITDETSKEMIKKPEDLLQEVPSASTREGKR
ncbi:hypothetical protein NBRC10512_003799 [Rhodotorula toruloides]